MPALNRLDEWHLGVLVLVEIENALHCFVHTQLFVFSEFAFFFLCKAASVWQRVQILWRCGVRDTRNTKEMENQANSYIQITF